MCITPTAGWRSAGSSCVDPPRNLKSQGRWVSADGVALALSAEGTANATLLTVFDPNLQATGRSTLHLRLTGTPERPLLNGTIDIQDVSLGLQRPALSLQ